MSDESDGWLEVTVRVRDPIAARLIRRIAERSTKGERYYGNASIADRLTTPSAAAAEALDEAVDLSLYVETLLDKLTAPQG